MSQLPPPGGPGNPANPYSTPGQAPMGGQGPQENQTLSIVSLVLGIISIVLAICCGGFSLPVSIAGIICGVMGKDKGGSGMAMGGIICSVIAIVLAIANVALGFYLRSQGLIEDPFAP